MTGNIQEQSEKERNSSWSKAYTSVKQTSRDSVRKWACMDAKGTDSLVFTDVTPDSSSRINSEERRSILSAYIQYSKTERKPLHNADE